MLGIDWLRYQGRFKWDFARGRIKFGNKEWIELRKTNQFAELALSKQAAD